MATRVSVPAATGIVCGPEVSPVRVIVGLETSTLGSWPLGAVSVVRAVRGGP